MRKIEDYLKHAAECRQMANNAVNEDQRKMLLQMVETWEGLARDRLEQITRQQRMSQFDVRGRTQTTDRTV